MKRHTSRRIKSLIWVVTHLQPLSCKHRVGTETGLGQPLSAAGHKLRTSRNTDKKIRPSPSQMHYWPPLVVMPHRSCKPQVVFSISLMQLHLVGKHHPELIWALWVRDTVTKQKCFTRTYIYWRLNLRKEKRSDPIYLRYMRKWSHSRLLSLHYALMIFKILSSPNGDHTQNRSCSFSMPMTHVDK